MGRDDVEADVRLVAEQRFVQQHSEQTDEVALVGADDVLERAQDGAVRARHGDLQLLRGQLPTMLDELVRRPDVVTQLTEHGMRHVWRIGLPRLTNRPRPLRPRNVSLSTMTSPRDITTI